MAVCQDAMRHALTCDKPTCPHLRCQERRRAALEELTRAEDEILTELGEFIEYEFAADELAREGVVVLGLEQHVVDRLFVQADDDDCCLAYEATSQPG